MCVGEPVRMCVCSIQRATARRPEIVYAPACLCRGPRMPGHVDTGFLFAQCSRGTVLLYARTCADACARQCASVPMHERSVARVLTHTRADACIPVLPHARVLAKLHTGVRSNMNGYVRGCALSGGAPRLVRAKRLRMQQSRSACACNRVRTHVRTQRHTHVRQHSAGVPSVRTHTHTQAHASGGPVCVRTYLRTHAHAYIRTHARAHSLPKA